MLRARTLFPDAKVSVDLHEAHLAQTEAVDLLRRSLEAAQPTTGPVRIAVPDAPAGGRPPGHHHRPGAAP